METVHIKTGASTGLTGKTCNDGSGVNASTGFAVKKCMLFITFIFKATARINTADNKKQTLAGAVGVFTSIVLDIYFLNNIVFVSATVRPIPLVEKNKGHLALLLMIFPCLHRHTTVKTLPLNMTR